MSNGIDLFIGKGKFLLCGVKQSMDFFDLGAEPADFALNFSIFTHKNKQLLDRPITIYISDDHLYFTHINLPQQTPDLKKAIELQLDTLSPFGEKCLYAYKTSHQKESIDVALYLANQRILLPIIETITGLEWLITGMYPESQRGVGKDPSKKTWGLLSDGLFTKLTIFKNGYVRERIQISGTEDNTLLKKTYHLSFIQHIENLPPIPSPPTFPLDFNLLPQSFRRTNYRKWIVIGLLVLNLILASVWVSMNFIKIQMKINQIESLQTELTPKIQEAQKLKQQHSRLNKRLKSYEAIPKNRNLIKLFATLTQKLPNSSHLDQLRLDKKTGVIHIQGYTTNLADLTASLQVIGEATLKSTQKRKGQTYFQIEVMPQ